MVHATRTFNVQAPRILPASAWDDFMRFFSLGRAPPLRSYKYLTYIHHSSSIHLAKHVRD